MVLFVVVKSLFDLAMKGLKYLFDNKDEYWNFVVDKLRLEYKK